MFDIGWSELVVIAVVALIAIGPKELPAVLRTVGQYMGKIRRMASEFQGQFQEAMREAEMADLKKSVDEMTDAAKGFTHFDPIESVKKELDQAISDTPKAEPVSPATATDHVPSPVAAQFAPDVSIPGPAAELAVAPEAPQPAAPAPEAKDVKAGSGA
jgi:sec-independent protein translocase protein TatB